MSIEFYPFYIDCSLYGGLSFAMAAFRSYPGQQFTTYVIPSDDICGVFLFLLDRYVLARRSLGFYYFL